MNEFTEVLKDNWYILLIIVVIVVFTLPMDAGGMPIANPFQRLVAYLWKKLFRRKNE